MSGQRVTRVRNTTAEPTTVWAVLTDIDRASRTLAGVTAVERIEGAGYDVGTRWRETRHVFGGERTDEMVVTVAEPPRTTTVESVSSEGTQVATFTIQPTGTGCRVVVEHVATLAHPTVAQKIMGVLNNKPDKRTEEIVDQDLLDICHAAEGKRR